MVSTFSALLYAVNTMKNTIDDAVYIIDWSGLIDPDGQPVFTRQLELITRGENDEFVTRQLLPVRFVPLTGGY